MRQRELLLRSSKDLCAVGQGGWAGCLGPGADCMEEALHNRLLSEPGLAGLAEPRWGQGSMQPPGAVAQSVHCCGSAGGVFTLQLPGQI